MRIGGVLFPNIVFPFINATIQCDDGQNNVGNRRCLFIQIMHILPPPDPTSITTQQYHTIQKYSQFLKPSFKPFNVSVSTVQPLIHN